MSDSDDTGKGCMHHPPRARVPRVVLPPGKKAYENCVEMLRYRLSEGDLDRPVLIVGNGPSSRSPESGRLPENPIVFRMNYFFLEESPVFGTRVDGYFWAVTSTPLLEALLRCAETGQYEIRNYFTPVDLATVRDVPNSGWYHAAFQPQFDHWSVLAECPPLARLLGSRPLPTQGMQALGTALALGYREVHLIGVDFYQSSTARYSYQIPTELMQKMDTKDYTPGYEKAHALELDLGFLAECLRAFPRANVFAVHNNAILNPIIDRSPQRP